MERWREEAVRNEIAFAKTLTLVWCIPCVSREGFIYKKLFQWPPFAFRRFSNIARLQDEGEDLSEDQRLRTQDSGRILRAAVFLPPDAVQPRIRRQVQTLQQVHPCGLLHANILGVLNWPIFSNRFHKSSWMILRKRPRNTIFFKVRLCPWQL